jgi:predicted dehydrogenase
MAEAHALVKLVKESDIKFQVGHVERFNPAFLAIKDHPMNPMFIEVHRLAQFNPRGTEVSVILDLMIHDIDIILSIVKSDVKYISASGVAVMTDTPDIANVRIEFTNGCVANLTSSRISMKKMRKIRLFQKDAYIGIDFLNKKSEIIKLKGDETDSANVFTFDIETAKGNKTIAISNSEIPEVNAIKKELEEFKFAIENNTRTIVSEIDGNGDRSYTSFQAWIEDLGWATSTDSVQPDSEVSAQTSVAVGNAVSTQRATSSSSSGKASINLSTTVNGTEDGRSVTQTQRANANASVD